MWGAVLALVAAPSSGRAQSAGSGSAEDAAALPEAIPLFPLPDVTLFPGVDQQLHIFEPRYRAMAADAVEGDQVIGLVMLRPGWEGNYEGNPPVYSIGGAGTIDSYERLSDGRYDMVLKGFVKFRILSEDTSGPYRVAEVEAIPETIRDEDRAQLSPGSERLLGLVGSIFPDAQFPAGLADEDLVNFLAQFVPLDPADRQVLLEEDSVLARSEVLIDLLEAMRPTSQALAGARAR